MERDCRLLRSQRGIQSPAIKVLSRSCIGARVLKFQPSELLMRRRAYALAVPTNDSSVRSRLRRLNEPITLFGEREMERRDRLRALMAFTSVSPASAATAWLLSVSEFDPRTRSLRSCKSAICDMPKGTLEVLLVNAQGLENTGFLCQMDRYCIIKCRTQQQKSSVASDQGRNPEWNEKFVFNITEGVSELVIKIMDKDTFTADDFVGEANIPLHGVFEAGSLPPMAYNVVLADYTYCGQIKVGLTFAPKGKHTASGFQMWDCHPH